jgi:hypothetical protein
MSSRCRYLRTTIMTGAPKLLIVQASAAVAEGRQGLPALSVRNNRQEPIAGPAIQSYRFEAHRVTRHPDFARNRFDSCFA